MKYMGEEFIKEEVIFVMKRMGVVKIMNYMIRDVIIWLLVLN